MASKTRATFTSEAERNAMRIMTFLQQQAGVPDAELAGPLHISRTSIVNRRQGKQRIDVPFLDAVARVFEVPPHLFLLPYEDALSWLIEHQHPVIRGEAPSILAERAMISGKRCSHLLVGVAA